MAGPAITVTVDDAGLAAEVNQALRLCMEAGAVDCASVLASGEAWEEACSIVAGSTLPVSAHLNCVEPPFLSDRSFPGSIPVWACRASSLADAVRREWSMQIERLLSRGVMVTGLDSHRHLHHLKPLAEVALDLAEEYGIRRVRTAVTAPEDGGLKGRLLRRLARKVACDARERGMATTGLLLGFGRAGRIDRPYLERAERLLDSEQASWKGDVELVMHPATAPLWNRGQPLELELLTSDWFEKWSSRNRG